MRIVKNIFALLTCAVFLSTAQSGFVCIHASEAKPASKEQQASVSRQEYLDSIAKKFRRNYFPLPGYCRCVAKVKFFIDAKGNPSNIQIVKSPVKGNSKKVNPINDSAMIYAVKKLADIPDLPSELANPSQILLTLDGRSDGPMKINAEAINEHVSSEK